MMIRALMLMMVCWASQAGADDFKVMANHEADYASIISFRIDKVTSSGGVSQANLDSLREMVKGYLLREGLRESKEVADVLVTVTTGVDVGMQNRELQGMPYYEGNQWHVLPRDEKETDPITAPMTERVGEGSLQIEMRNKNKQVIWQAIMRDVVNLPLSRDDLTRALDQVFAHYPPSPKR
jgi:hypothetical protein